MKLVERLLAVLGVLLVGWYAATSLQTSLYQRSAESALERAAATSAPTPTPDASITPPTATANVVPPRIFAKGDPIGRLEIPRIHLSVVIASGDDEKTLKVAAGHLPDTPLPWEPGNSAIAAHRDALFRPLRNVKVNDVVNVDTPEGQFSYRVTNLKIVEPTDLSVLEPTAQPSLTLITCYPFGFVGAAPKRFIVQAARCEDCAPLTE